MIGASCCLIGQMCTYSGSNNLVEGLKHLYEEQKIIAVCPEVMGGLPTPRPPAEIQSVDPLRIENNQKQNVTKEYEKGARLALETFKKNHVTVAILKFRSPSCGNNGVYDGSFTHTLIEGQGVFAKMCEENGIKVFNENQIDDFLKYIGKEEEYGTYFKSESSI